MLINWKYFKANFQFNFLNMQILLGAFNVWNNYFILRQKINGSVDYALIPVFNFTLLNYCLLTSWANVL